MLAHCLPGSKLLSDALLAQPVIVYDYLIPKDGCPKSLLQKLEMAPDPGCQVNRQRFAVFD